MSLRWSPTLTGLVALLFVGTWWFRGAHMGWTRDTVFREIPDPVTGLTGLVPEPQWTPGVDFLAAGALVAVGVGIVAAFLELRQRKLNRLANPSTGEECPERGKE